MTENDEYTQRLLTLSESRWKHRLGVQAPYRWNLRRLHPGRVLDIGCGLGRNLRHLGGAGVGVDHNESSVAVARSAGLTALTPDGFFASEFAVKQSFDALLVAHVLEHLSSSQARELLSTYLPYVRPRGMVIVITPQEKGYATDDTHQRFVDAETARRDLRNVGVAIERDYSFPFPRFAGRWFPYNEFVVIGRLPG